MSPNLSAAKPSNVTHVREPTSFGKRKEPHSITVTRNGHSRHYSVNPLFFTLTIGFLAMFSVGYFAATTYLVLRDDLISAGSARTARVQQEYEDRIAALRTNLDRITSRQLLDQQAVEAKVAELIERQQLLTSRSPALGEAIQKAGVLGIATKQLQPGVDTITTGAIGTSKSKSVPEKQVLLNSLPDDTLSLSLRGLSKTQNSELGTIRTAGLAPAPAAVNRNQFSYRPNSPLFVQIALTMQELDSNQKRKINTLRSSANDRLNEIATLMKRAGIKFKRAKKSANTSQIGGPFVPLDMNADFSSHLKALDYSLDALETVRANTNALPLKAPTTGSSYSSKFGPRLDPFKNTYAMHTGLDIRGKYGTPIRATGSGKVVFAGVNGGYGKFVEIKHANGFITRFAHMSKILVKKGQNIKAGTLVGKVGSSGRSTGPHLHYEIRANGKPVNPETYMRVGKKLAKLL